MLPNRPKSYFERFISYASHVFFQTSHQTCKEEKEFKLNHFIASDYYQMVAMGIKKNDTDLNSFAFSTSGMKLVAEYYQDKYQASISLEDKIDYSTLIANLRTTKADVIRKAFILRESPDSKHVFSLIYIKEKGAEGILIADSLGTSRSVSDDIARQTGITTYAVRHPRQATDYGCQVDALVFGRDCTGKNHDGSYIISDLLQRLNDRANKDGAMSYNVKLPDELLKTSQLSSFVSFHKESKNTLIHKDETLTMFRNRYTDKSVVVEKKGTSNKTDTASYLRLKGLKLGNIIQIQFYINQLKTFFAEDWSDKLRNEFIAQAKQAFSTSSDIFSVADNFLKMKPQSSEKIEIIISK